MKNLNPRLLRRAGKGLLFILIVMAGLGIADTAMRHPDAVASLRAWMSSTRYGWLAWRLCLYGATGWGFWKIWRAPGFRSTYRLPLLRIAGVSALFALVCEYSIWYVGNEQ